VSNSIVRGMGAAVALFTLVGAFADRPAGAGEAPTLLAEGKNPNCLEWKVVRHCVETRPQSTVKPPKDPRNPEHDVEVTISDVCVKWEETATCVSWKGQPGR
jgi:hypothetical protein